MSTETLLQVPASASIFGFEPRPARLTVRPRSLGWRAARAGGLAGGGLVAAPVVALLPPHVAWALGSVVTGGFLGYRKWSERFTVEEIEGVCPKCDAALTLTGAMRLRRSCTLPCAECHHDLQLQIDDGAVDGI